MIFLFSRETKRNSRERFFFVGKLKILCKIIPESGTFIRLLFSSKLFQFIMVAQWLVSQTSTATGPGTKSRHGVGLKKEILLSTLKQQFGQLGHNDLQWNKLIAHRLWGASGPCIPPPEHAHFNTHQSGTQPLELRFNPATHGFKKLGKPSKLPSDQI